MTCLRMTRIGLPTTAETQSVMFDARSVWLWTCSPFLSSPPSPALPGTPNQHPSRVGACMSWWVAHRCTRCRSRCPRRPRTHRPSRSIRTGTRLSK